MGLGRLGLTVRDVMNESVKNFVVGFCFGFTVVTLVGYAAEWFVSPEPVVPVVRERKADLDYPVVRELKEDLGYPVDPITLVQSMPSTYRNITISGKFGTVTVVGDAEKFLDQYFGK